VSQARADGATLWIDVEDLLHYAMSFRRPSGIQRLAFELYAAFGQTFPGQVRFVRQDRLRGGFVTVDWAEVTARFARITAPAPATAPPPAPRPSGQRLRRWLERLPAEVRAPLVAGLRAQATALTQLGASLAAAARLLSGKRRSPAGETAADGVRLDRLARKGDVLAAFGAPWSGSQHPALLREARMRLGLRVALLIYDLIPLRRPEWCEPAMAARFGTWFDAVLPLADHLFAISRATANDVLWYAERAGIALPGPVLPVPVGSGFAAPPPRPASDLPVSGSYVLFVGTLEARKNHLLLVRTWRRLLDALPPEQVPQLVFAGRVGFLATDLLAEMRNSGFLGGKLLLIEHPDDAELAALYRGCLFTVFPSLYEGWGLPVTESLAFGKPCLAAEATAVPEAGGRLARYFDPESVPDAVRALRAVLDDRAGLSDWQAQVRREFRPVPWSDTARAIAAALGLEAPAA
jgi:glycosyltransferase involved in cell wall biosynthesis